MFLFCFVLNTVGFSDVSFWDCAYPRVKKGLLLCSYCSFILICYQLSIFASQYNKIFLLFSMVWKILCKIGIFIYFLKTWQNSPSDSGFVFALQEFFNHSFSIFTCRTVHAFLFLDSVLQEKLYLEKIYFLKIFLSSLNFNDLSIL